MGESVAGKVIIMTGASSGIGRAAARLLAREGAMVALVARDSSRLRSLGEALGAPSIVVPADLAEPGDTDRMV
ncbi:MAG: SDR family NAD(P)-dependent oxidoreductase [Proteobacteria bacterium]|nr:SDR family NAD(P)-dependent oxidoreductase [Pseudomonadota bacterium]